MSKTKIMKCTCANEYQDEKYGQQMRVHNETAKNVPGQGNYHRCTVCLKERV